MTMKIKYKYRLYLYLCASFILLTTFIITIVCSREQKLKKEAFELKLIAYINIVDEYISQNQLNTSNLENVSSLLPFFPEDLRLSILDGEGYILFDNKLAPEEWIESRMQNTEIKKALRYGRGWNIRKSIDTSWDCDFIYYAVYEKIYIIRIGLPYLLETESFFKINRTFLFFIISVFLLLFVIISAIYWTSRLSVKNIKQFVSTFPNNRKSEVDISFIDEELTEIQSMMINLCNQMEESKKDISLEREKLLEHFHFAEEGISFFTPTFENIYTNANFIQYLNILLNEPTFDVSNLFKSPVFNEVVHFLENSGNENSFSSKLFANGKHFFVHVIIFDDKSFEVIIRDISKSEKNNFDRTEMTNNIAHELKTPVTSVRGYLETLIEHKNLSPEKRDDFMQRAYTQIIRLSEIIQDVILLSKTKDAPQFFKMEDVNIYDMLHEIIDGEDLEMLKNNCIINIKVPKDVIIRGNRTLLYSIFRNLGNNALKYAGDNTTITIHNYMEDSNFYYFSFADNGKGVDEKHLDHIFERFYRITEGRTRDKGGSGLGLAIVKDAVAFHHGEIHAKNRAGGGLEFLFTLRKK